MNAEEFLAGVRRSIDLQRTVDPGPTMAAPGRPNPDDLLDVFRDRLTGLEGLVHEPGSAADAASLVESLIVAADVESFMSWDSRHLPVDGLLTHLRERGLERIDDVVPTEASGRRRRQEGYYDYAVGITGAEAGLAESGSIVVASGQGRSRMASLIPSLHIALLSRDRMWASLAHWIQAHPEALGSEANWTVITGPSRTADIEQALTLGVHGPREVHVLLV